MKEQRKTGGVLAAIIAAAAFGLAGCGDRSATTTSGANALPPDMTSVVRKVPLAAKGDVVRVIQSDPRFTILARALQTAGLTRALQAAGNVTVFAPTDEAFRKLKSDQLQSLLVLPAERTRLIALLKYHVAPKQIMMADLRALPNKGRVPTMGVASLTINKKGNNLRLEGATNTAHVIQADIPASNGMVQAIDTVLMPPPDMIREGTPPKPASTQDAVPAEPSNNTPTSFN